VFAALSPAFAAVFGNNLEGIACKCLHRYMLLPVPLLNWHLLIELETDFHASMFKGGGRAENRQEPLSY